MNIMLTNHCNLNCKYCFAHDSIDNKNKKEVSFENFKYYISFIKKNKYKKLNLIGGEPTLHTKFFDLLEY
jgi:MoaA/NifB/PqqE/SkfB family radical SAM enzyme